MPAPGFHHPIRIDDLITVGVAKCRVAHTVDLTTAGLSQVLDFNALALGSGESPFPANARPMFAWVNIIDPISGGTIDGALVKVGDVVNDDELIEDITVFTGASGIKPKTGTYTLGTFEAAYTPLVTITTTTGNISTADAGVLEVCIQYEAIGSQAVTA